MRHTLLSPAVHRSSLAVAVSAAMMAAAGGAQAGAVIFNAGNNPTTATVALGVNNEGHLNFFPEVDEFPWDDGFTTQNAGSTGLAAKFPDGSFRDGTAPGCLCEGWGFATTTPGGRVSAYASVDNGGIDGIADGTFGATPNSATSRVNMEDANVSITHAYGVSLAPNVFQGNVTIRNNEAFTLEDMVYRRVMDWDIPPTEFDEFVTIQGVEDNLEANGGNVRFSSDDGFFSADPLDVPGPFDTISAPSNTDFIDNGPDDHGALFDFAFGDLAPGESFSFNIFYGAAPDEATAMNAINTLGADVWSFGQSNPDGFGYGGDFSSTEEGSPATFIFAFGGVGGVETGTTEDNPILPFVPAPGAFVFTEPTPRRWFDPPFVDTFEYELVGSDPTLAFTEVMAPSGFFDMCIEIGGVAVECDFDAGESFTAFGGATSFSISGISPLVDSEDPLAFPTFLDWSGTADELLMTGIEPLVDGTIPLPGTLWLFGIGLGGLMTTAYRKREAK